MENITTTREKKFRIWDKERNRTSLPFELGDQVIMWSDGDIDMPLQFALVKSRRFITMQYIGSKDKDGVEIYEKDIIEEGVIGETIWNGSGEVVECPTGIVEIGLYNTNIKELRCGKVKLQKGKLPQLNNGHGFTDLHLSIYNGIFIWNRIKAIKVIGNVFENVELL